MTCRAYIFHPHIHGTGPHVVNGHFGDAVAGIMSKRFITLIAGLFPRLPLLLFKGAGSARLARLFLLDQPRFIKGHFFLIAGIVGIQLQQLTIEFQVLERHSMPEPV